MSFCFIPIFFSLWFIFFFFAGLKKVAVVSLRIFRLFAGLKKVLGFGLIFIFSVREKVKTVLFFRKLASLLKEIVYCETTALLMLGVFNIAKVAKMKSWLIELLFRFILLTLWLAFLTAHIHEVIKVKSLKAFLFSVFDQVFFSFFDIKWIFYNITRIFNRSYNVFSIEKRTSLA